MKAWQFTETHVPLALNDVAEPEAGPGQVVIDVRAVGLCHSDVGILEVDHFLPPMVPVPLTLGHEIAGDISQIGEGVGGWATGDRVAIALLAPFIPGLSMDGGYAARVAVNADLLVSIPKNVTYAQAAAGTDAGVTAYHAIRTDAAVQKGQKVGIIGLGGLGQVGARVAVLAGAEVYAAEVKRDIWPIGEGLGVTKVVEDISEFADLGLDVIVDFAGFGTTTAAAIDTVRIEGRVVQVGLGVTSATVSTQSLVMKKVTLVGALGGSKEDVGEVFALMASGDLDPILSTISFDEIPDGLTRLSRGEVVGRLVATYGD